MHLIEPDEAIDIDVCLTIPLFQQITMCICGTESRELEREKSDEIIDFACSSSDFRYAVYNWIQGTKTKMIEQFSSKFFFLSTHQCCALFPEYVKRCVMTNVFSLWFSWWKFNYAHSPKPFKLKLNILFGIQMRSELTTSGIWTCFFFLVWWMKGFSNLIHENLFLHCNQMNIEEIINHLMLDV